MCGDGGGVGGVSQNQPIRLPRIVQGNLPVLDKVDGEPESLEIYY